MRLDFACGSYYGWIVVAVVFLALLVRRSPEAASGEPTGAGA